MVLDAARALGVAPTTLAVVGDIGADVEAATAQGVLVPNALTRQEEIAGAAAPVRTWVRRWSRYCGAAPPGAAGPRDDAPAGAARCLA